LASEASIVDGGFGRPGRLGWLAISVLLTLITTGGIYLLNHYVHLTYVTESGPRQSLRVLSWNIGKIYLPWESRAADRDLQHVAKVINDANPHVVALQEIRDATQLGRLLVALGPGWRGKVPKDAYDRRAALLVRLGCRFFDIPTSSGRTAQGAVVRLPSGRHVTFVSVHLDAFDPQRRLRQAEELIAGAQRWGNDELFLAGDLNFDPSLAASDSLDRRLYRFLASTLSDAGRDAGSTTIFSRRLDYVFYRSPRVRRARARVLRGRRINTMDHDPLLVEFELVTPER